MMNRRQFLRVSTAALMAGGLSWRAWATPAGGDARLVVVFLRGACDGLSVLVPFKESFYYESRPTIAIAPPDESNPLAALPLDGNWGLHPSLAESVWPLYQAGQVAFVPFAGTEFVSRSHFQAQDWIESGAAALGPMSVSSGFLNRLLAVLGNSSQGIGFTQTLPIALRGGRPVANTPVRLSTGQVTDQATEALLLKMYAQHPLLPLVEEGIGVRRELSRELAEEMQAASRGALPASGFALEAGRIARFMREQGRYRIAFVDVGGWDTHASQGGAQGALANRLGNLGQGLAKMAHEFGDGWRHTAVVVVSEFGRTFRENGSKGTDHGHGNVLWVLGGGIRGGRIVGEQMRLRAGKLHEDRDVPVLNGYRDVLAGLLGRMYGLGPEALATVFPGCKPRDLWVT